MLDKIKDYFSDFEDSFYDILDHFFPYKKWFQQMSAEEFISQYHHKHIWTSIRFLLYQIPFFINYIFLFVFTISTFVLPDNRVDSMFRNFFAGFLVLTIGYFFALTRRLKGPLLLQLGFCILYNNDAFGELFRPDTYLLFTILLFLNICRSNRFTYYRDLAANVLKNKMRIETEDMELDYLMGKYTVDFDIYQKKCAQEQENEEDDFA